MMGTAWLPIVVAVLGVGVRVVAAEKAPANESVYWIQVHAWLMWASFGFLFPLGVILVRYNQPQSDSTSLVSPARVRMIIIIHAFVQCLGVGFATSGFVVLYLTKGNVILHTHEKLGLALLILVLMLPFIGLLRPSIGTQLRPYWFSIHWLFGTAAVLLGLANIFIGIFIYQYFLKRKIAFLNTAFSVQVALMGLIYFLQDKWTYILGQGYNENSKLRRRAGDTVI